MMQIMLAIAATLTGFLPNGILDLSRRRLAYLSRKSNFFKVKDSGVLNDPPSCLANDRSRTPRTSRVNLHHVLIQLTRNRSLSGDSNSSSVFNMTSESDSLCKICQPMFTVTELRVCSVALTLAFTRVAASKQAYTHQREDCQKHYLAAHKE